jgi:hypothetical protein
MAKRMTMHRATQEISEPQTELVTTTWKTIGLVCVDTGTLILGDPSHVDDLDLGKMFTDGELVRQIRKKLHSGAYKHRKTMPSCVSLTTGIGDGFYEVEAEIIVESPGGGETIKSIRVEFLGDDYVAEMKEHAAERAIKERDRPHTRVVVGGEEKLIDNAIAELVRTLEAVEGVTVVHWGSHHIDCGRVILEGPRAFDFILAMALLAREQGGDHYTVDLGIRCSMAWSATGYPLVLAAAKKVAAQMEAA